MSQAGPSRPRPELLAPAGSFAAGVYAFEAGADGVYLGMRDFSARKSAVNFSRDELRRLLCAARQVPGRRVYVAVNTVVREDEIPSVVDLFAFLDALGVDGVIVQDLGVARILAEHFPALPVHGSTQMAVHNPTGVRALRELGFRRVVLARELTLDRIRRIRASCPDVEIEVFVHGAMCFSVSGLCLASGLELGRSGNRGECAQLCRGYYRMGLLQTSRQGVLQEARTGGENGCWFSCRDLAAEEEALALRDIGVDALKIEGRMKSPEYVYHHTAMYRALLSGLPPGSARFAELKRACELTFSRESGKGYLRGPRGDNLLNAGFPGHRGIPLGEVRGVRGGRFTLRVGHRLSRRDGLMFFGQGHPPPPVQFSARRLFAAGGREIPFARAGSSVSVEADAMPRAGQVIHLISSRFQDLKAVAEGRYAPVSAPLPCLVRVGRGGRISAEAELGGARVEAAEDAAVQAARGPQDFGAVVRRVFAQADRCLYRAEPRIEVEEGGPAGSRVFVPPSSLKRLRKAFYGAVEEAHAALVRRVVESLRGAAVPRPAWSGDERVARLLPELSRRERLTPLRAAGGRHEAPFVETAEEAARLAGRGDPVFLPLPPVLVDEEPFMDGIERLVRSRPDRLFVMGINNAHHLALARRLEDAPNAAFFADFYTYAANRHAVLALLQRVPRLAFVYYWIEGDARGFRDLAAALGPGFPLLRIGPEFNPPLFLSLACLRRGHGADGACRGCGRRAEFALANGPRRYTALVRDCATYLFRDRSGHDPRARTFGGPRTIHVPVHRRGSAGGVALPGRTSKDGEQNMGRPRPGRPCARI